MITLRAGRPGNQGSIPGGAETRLFSTSSGSSLGSTPTAARRVPWPVYTGLKRSRREADQSPVSGAKVKNASSYTYNLPYVAFVSLLEGPSNTPMLAVLTVCVAGPGRRPASQ
jgi:hypothetical protein